MGDWVTLCYSCFMFSIFPNLDIDHSVHSKYFDMFLILIYAQHAHTVQNVNFSTSHSFFSEQLNLED